MGTAVGAYIKQLREDAGLSQSDLASLVGFKTAQSIANIESGRFPLLRKHILVIAKALEANPMSILGVMNFERRQNMERLLGT